MQSNAIKVLLLLLIVLLGWMIYQNIEQYEELVDYGWSEKAQRNPYLALHQFLVERETPIESVTHFAKDSLEGSVTTLMIPDANFIQLPSQQREILAWVEAGGHLIVGLGYEEKPPILTTLGFSQTWSYNENDDYYGGQDEDYDGDKDNDEASDEDEEQSLGDRLREQNERILENREKSERNKTDGDDEDEEPKPICKSYTYDCNVHVEPELDNVFLVDMNFEGEEQPLYINFSWTNYIKHEAFFTDPESEEVLENPLDIEPFYWAGDDGGIHFAQTYYGDGMVSILSDFDVWHSSNIGHFDHAYLATVLVDRDDQVLLLYGKYMPSLDVLLYRHFFEALISVSILILLSLMYYSRRFGPIFSLSQQTRRSRGEQFSALSQFHWKHQDSEKLLAHVRADIHRLATRHWHDFDEWPANRQHRQLATLCDLPVTTITKVMSGELRYTESEFTHTVRALQILRNAL